MKPSTLFRLGEPVARLPGRVCRASVALPDGDTLVMTDASLQCLEPDGRVKWTKGGEYVSDCSPVVGPQGDVYVAEVDKVSRLDGETGQPRWSYVNPTKGNFSVRLDLALGPNGELYTSTDRSRALRLDPETGQPEAEFCVARTWLGQRFGVGYGVDVSAAPDGAVVVQEAFRVVCREPDGRHRWSYRFSEAVNRPIYCRDRWLFSDNHGQLTALCPRTGREQWSTWSFVDNGGNINVDSVTPGTEGIVYFHPRANQLMALDENTGRVLASFGGSFDNPDHNWSSYKPVLGQDGKLYVSRSDSNELMTLDPRTLEPLGSPLETAGKAPQLVSGSDWLISSEPSGTLRLDNLHPPSPTTVQAEPGHSQVEERDGQVIVGGVTLPRR